MMGDKKVLHNTIRQRILAGFLCLCMIITIFSGLQLTVFAADDSAGSPTIGAIRQADPSTMDTYQNILDFSENTRYAGRFWSDKSVYAYDYDNGDEDWNNNTLTLNKKDDGLNGKISLDADFLHVFSAMGSSLSLSTQNIRPLDVVLLLDISTSMTNQNLGNDDSLHQMLNDANNLIATLMNNAVEQGGQADPSIHKNNRVGVVLYGGGAQTVMDLNHYTSNDNQGTYLSLADSVAKPSSTAYFPRIKANVTGGKTSGYMFADSTYLQGALYQGMNILANASFDGGSAGNTTGRVPVLVVLSDGGTNVVTASSVDGTRNAYTFDSTKAYNASNQTFTAFPVLTGVSWHNPYNGIVPVEGGSGNRRIWPLEGNPVYGSLNNENQLTPNLRSAIMMSNLLMAGSMQKRIEEHYRKGVADESKISMYGYSILLNSKALGNNEKEMMYATLDPVNYLKSNSQGPSGTAAGEGTLRDYACAKTAYSWLNEYVSGNTTVSKTATSNWGPTNGSKTKTATFNFDHLTGADEKYDINSIADVYYIDKSITTESGDLGVIFDQIIDEVTTNIFIPVGGGNDLGESNSVTYMDPMGKYMDVKDVKSLTLFGENYALAKTAMYSYAWNKLYLENSNDFDADKDVLPSGWYKGDPVEGDNSGVQKATGALPEGCATAKEAWNNGWVYRVGFKIATQFVPSLNEVSSPADINEEQKNTEYTFYRINASDQERKKLRMNPAFGTEENIPPRIQYNDNGEHLQTPGVYTLADLRVWVENTGDYNDSLVDNDVIQTDSNFDRALYVHIPANMLPIRAVTVNEKLTAGDSSFSSNQDSTFPLRLFYTVGIEDALLTDDGSLNITSGVNPTYIQNNKSTPETSTTDARNIDSDVGVIEFFSNWYNQERRYAVYDTASVREGDTTFGDPIVSFAPSVDNRYYVFEKALPLYSRAFIYENNQWNEVTFNSTGRVPTEFGGKLICQDLEVANLTNADTQITSALQAKGIQNVEEGNVVFLKSDRMSDVTRPNDGSADPFSSDDYYFMALEYFEMKGKAVDRIQYAVARKGNEFGSAYQSIGINNGNMLCWHDVSGQYPDYSYLSYTDTGDSSRGYNYIGFDADSIFNTDAEGNKTTLKQPTDFDAATIQNAEAIRNNGDWVVSARPGGLRVGYLSQSIGAKGGNYNNYSDAYVQERFPNSDTKKITWGYYDNNVTRTSNNYYMPTVSPSSDIEDENIVINVYLGNNGRLWVSDTSLMMTKLLVPGPSGELPKDADDREFDFQVYVRDYSGARDAIRVRYNEKTKTWQRELHSIDLALDGNRYLQTNDGQKVMVDANGRQVVLVHGLSDQNTYVYADDSNTVYTGELYYVRIPAVDQSDVGGSPTEFRIYHNQYCEDRDTTVKEDSIVVYDKDKEGNSGKCDFYAASGTLLLVSKSDYDSAKSTQLDSIGNPFNSEFYLATMNPTAYADKGDSSVAVESPYNIQSTYLTQKLYFGYKYGATGTGNAVSGEALTEDDLYIPASDDAYSGSKNPEANTAEVKLKNGWGLAFSSMDSGVDYVMAEKLNNKAIAEGYIFDHANQVTQNNNATVMPSEFSGFSYYLSGETGAKEEAGHFVNTWSDDKTETQINGQELPENDNPIKPGVQIGDEITYKVNWFNNTNENARVVITDPLDKGVDFVSADNNGKYFKTQKEANDYLKAQGLNFTAESDHIVIWDLGTQAVDSKGFINLTVKVNDDATEWWSYTNDGTADEPVDENYPKDFFVKNRATVRVADNVWNTNTVINTVRYPKKTETLVERGEESKGNNYEDEDVIDTGENANLILGEDGKFEGPLVFAGDKITYGVEWRNYAEENAVVTIVDPLDPNVRFVSADYDPSDFKDLEDKTLTGLKPNTKQKIEATADDSDVETSDVVEGYGDNGDETRKTISYDAKRHAVTWNLGEMPAGAYGKATLVVEVKKSAVPAGHVDNTGYVYVGNDMQQTHTMKNPTPYQEKTEVTPGDGVMVQIGDSVTYNVNWRNYKKEPAQVVIMDTLDPGADFAKAGQNGTYYKDGGKVTVDGVGEIDVPAHTVVWVLEKQPAGATGTVTLTVNVNENAKLENVYNDDATGFESSNEKDYEIYNQARVKIGNDSFIKTQIVNNPIPEKAETSISHTIGDVDDTPNLIPKKDAENTYSGPYVFPGDEITYEIHWKNGHKDAADVIVSDSLDKGVDFVSASNGGEYNKDTHTVIWKLNDREANAEGTVTLKVKVNDKATAAGIVDNQAGVKIGNDPLVETETIENPTPHEEKTEVTPGEGMQVTTGSEVDYQITWHNYEQTASDVVITDKLDPGVDFVSAGVNGNKLVSEASAVATHSDDYKLGDEEPTYSAVFANQNLRMYYFEKAHTVVWVLENRPANSNGVVDLKVRVNDEAVKFWSYDNPTAKPSDSSDDDRIRNQAGVKVGNNPEVKTRIIENPTKPEKTETNVNNTDVSNELVADENGYVGPEVNVGDTIKYQITWQNNAIDEDKQPVKAQVSITDKLDAGVDFVGASNGGTYNKDTHTVVWNLGEKDARDHGVVTLTVRVNSKAAAPKQVENEATVTVANKSEQTNKVKNPVGTKGGLTVSKTVSGDAGDTTQNWNFTVTLSDKSVNGQFDEMFFVDGVATFTLKHNESIKASGLPAEIQYTVTEAEANEDGYTTTSTGEKGTIPASDYADVKFENHKSTPPPEEHFGNLVVSKTVAGNKGETNREWHFRVELSDASVTGKFGDMSFVAGVATFTLKHGESITAKDLPADVEYTVTENEANEDGYTTTSEDAKGNIVADSTVKAEFVNSRNEEIPPEKNYGDLVVSKTVTGNMGDFNRAWNFRVELSDTSINGQFGDMKFVNGVAEFTLKHGESSTAQALPKDITYTVTEKEANQDGYTTSSSDATGKITAVGTAKAEFINNKNDESLPKENHGNLVVSKTVKGNMGELNRKWNFRVELSDKTINGQYGNMLFKNGVAEFTLKHGESSTALNLPKGITYTVTEKEANKDGYATSATGATGKIADGKTVTASFTNTKNDNSKPKKGFGHLVVNKKVTGKGDLTRKWHFRVELSDKSINGQYGNMFFTDGVAEFTLKHGESLSALNLPKNITYVVTEKEANKDGYTTDASDATGKILDGKTVTAQFINNMNDPSVPNEPTDDNPNNPNNPNTSDDGDNSTGIGLTQFPPDTGYNSHFGLYVAMIILSMIGIVVISVSLLKKKDSLEENAG